MTIHIEGGYSGPPYSSDLLADLHAGIVPKNIAHTLWPTVLQDRSAVEFLDSLDDTSALLRSLNTVEPEEGSAPPEVLSRITEALPSNVLAFAPPKKQAARSRLHILGIAVGSIAACAALVFGITTVVGYNADKELDNSSVAAIPPQTTYPPSTSLLNPGANPTPGSGNDQTNFLTYLGKRELGPLSEPAALEQCLAANGLINTQLLGSGTITVDGQAGVLLLIPGPNPATITALVVDMRCSANNPALISRTNIGMP